MKQEDALRAFRQGDYETAAQLLETLVRDNRYSSDVLNNAYTIALYSTGKTEELADATFRIGQVYEQTNPSLALGDYQRTIYSGLDPTRTHSVCEFQTRLTLPSTRVLQARSVPTISHT